VPSNQRHNSGPAKKKPRNAAFAVRYYGLTDWPELTKGQSLSTSGTLFGDEPISGNAPRGTMFRPAELWRPSDFQKLEVTHERRKRGYTGPFTQRWRTDDGLEDSVVEHYDFSAYLTADRRGIYMRANRTIAEGALRAIRNRHGIGFERGEIDVKEFLARYKSDEVQRAWFSNLNIANVQSVAISGKNVDKSEDFSRYLDRGDLSAVQIAVVWDAMRYNVVVSQANAIFFYMGDEARAIRLAGYVNGILRQLSDVVSIQPVTNPEPPLDEEEPGPDLSLGYELTQLDLSDGEPLDRDQLDDG
jgi:hypothetical protein